LTGTALATEHDCYGKTALLVKKFLKLALILGALHGQHQQQAGLLRGKIAGEYRAGILEVFASAGIAVNLRRMAYMWYTSNEHAVIPKDGNSDGDEDARALALKARKASSKRITTRFHPIPAIKRCRYRTGVNPPDFLAYFVGPF